MVGLAHRDWTDPGKPLRGGDIGVELFYPLVGLGGGCWVCRDGLGPVFAPHEVLPSLSLCVFILFPHKRVGLAVPEVRECLGKELDAQESEFSRDL